MTTLFLVGTPIGNLEDITPRALRVLKEVDLIAAEDTRRAKILLTRYEINTPVISYHEQGAKTRTSSLLKRLRTQDVAIITEAGMPSISDPGFGIVSAAVKAGFLVDVIPGASAVATALAISGLPTYRFTFLGFPPRKAAERRRFLQGLRYDPGTLVLFEAPHRLTASLKDAVSTLGNRRIAICRELTKLHQEVFRGSIDDAIKHFDSPRGEFTIVIEGSADEPTPPVNEARQALEVLAAKGVPTKEAVAEIVARFRVPRRTVYRLWLEVKRERTGAT